MTTPHLAWPVRIEGNTLATTPQGSVADIEGQARLLLSTRPAERIALLDAAGDYGITDQAGTRDIDLEPIRAAMRRWIPGGEAVQVSATRTDGGDTINVSVTI